jgi:O-antigen ligase
MSVLIPFAVFLAIEDRGRRWLWGLAFVLLTAGVLATLSRGALVGVGALLVWALLSRRIPLTGVLAGAAASASILALALAFWSPLINERIELKGAVARDNADSRQAYWAAAVRMAADHPLVGVGPDRFGTESPDYIRNNPVILPNPVVHNSYLEILAENGPFALAAFLAFLAATWRSLSSAHRRAVDRGDAAGRRLTTALQSTMVVVLVSSFFLSAQVAIPFWLIGGLAVGVAASTTPHRLRAGSGTGAGLTAP